jgi:uncharacterized membrane protein
MMDDNAYTIAPHTIPRGLGAPGAAGGVERRSDPEEVGSGGRQIPVAARWRPTELILLSLACASLAASCALLSPMKYFWCDEVFSWTVVSDQSFRHMVAALSQAADGAPPFFYLIARTWSRAFGTGELALRSVSCLGFIAAMGVMWAVLRRVYGMWPAAIASVTVFATSQLVLYQIAEARFYGQLTALVAGAVYLYARAVSARRYTRSLFALTALVHAGLLYTHVYGVLYSAAILAAWVIADGAHGRPWDARYLSVVAGWLSFVPWLPALKRLAAVGNPHTWIGVPRWPDLVNTYAFTLLYVPSIVVATVALGVLASSLPDRAERRSSTRPIRLWRTNVAKIAAGAVVLLAALWYVPRPLTLASVYTAWTAGNSMAVLALLLVVVVHCVQSRVHLARSDVAPPEFLLMDESMLIVGAALLAVPVVAFFVSHLGPSIFFDRYFIPASLGVMPILAHFARWCTSSAPGGRENRSASGLRPSVVDVAWTVLIVLIAVQPTWVNRKLRAQPRPGNEIEAVVPNGMTVVVESVLDLLPLRQYQRRHDLSYVYPMDWDAAMDPHSYSGATLEYHLMDNWRRVGYLSAPVARGTRVPCDGRPFVVVHSWRHSWYNDRIANDSAFVAQSIGRSWSTLETSDILLIHPRASIVPAMCRDAAPVNRSDRGAGHSLRG